VRKGRVVEPTPRRRKIPRVVRTGVKEEGKRGESRAKASRAGSSKTAREVARRQEGTSNRMKPSSERVVKPAKVRFTIMRGSRGRVEPPKEVALSKWWKAKEYLRSNRKVGPPGAGAKESQILTERPPWTGSIAVMRKRARWPPEREASTGARVGPRPREVVRV
jgi:hypothetical protein